MKKHFPSLVLAIFLLVSSFFANATSVLFYTIEEGVIWNVKTGEQICVFNVPEQYLDKDNNLLFPLEITFKKEGKPPIVLMPSNNLVVTFPYEELSGIYTMEVKVADFVLIKDVLF